MRFTYVIIFILSQVIIVRLDYFTVCNISWNIRFKPFGGSLGSLKQFLVSLCV